MNDVIIQQGWECPKCKRVYSPTTPMCMYCPQSIASGTSTDTHTSYGTYTSMLHNFISDGNGTAPKCIKCGLEQWRHPIISLGTSS
jgi:methionyl-tRNA synthetase